jgi:hypothetical protein
MTRRLSALVLIGPLLLVSPLLLVGCVGGIGTAPNPEGPPVSSGVEVEGDGWSATFPGEVEQRVDPFPLPELGLELDAKLAVWENDTDALVVQFVEFPATEADQAAVLLETAAAAGDVVDSPALDGDGTFQGRDAVVVSAVQQGADLQLLAFLDGARLYQIIHVSSDPATEHNELVLLADSFAFRP